MLFSMIGYGLHSASTVHFNSKCRNNTGGQLDQILISPLWDKKNHLETRVLRSKASFPRLFPCSPTNVGERPTLCAKPLPGGNPHPAIMQTDRWAHAGWVALLVAAVFPILELSFITKYHSSQKHLRLPSQLGLGRVPVSPGPTGHVRWRPTDLISSLPRHGPPSLPPHLCPSSSSAGTSSTPSLPARVHRIRGRRLEGQLQVLRVGCTEGQGVTLTSQGNQDEPRLLPSRNHVALLVDHHPKPAGFKTQDPHGPLCGSFRPMLSSWISSPSAWCV